MPGQEPGLRIGVLGTFTVNGAPAALQPAQSQLILALALNGRDGLSNAQLCYLLGADPDHPKPSDSLRQLIVRTRRQLGRAADGREWIEHLGAGQYALHPDARFDWADFEELSERGIAGRDDRLPAGSPDADPRQAVHRLLPLVAGPGLHRDRAGPDRRRGGTARRARARGRRPVGVGPRRADRAGRRRGRRAAVAGADARRARGGQPRRGPGGVEPLPGRDDGHFRRRRAASRHGRALPAAHRRRPGSARVGAEPTPDRAEQAGKPGRCARVWAGGRLCA